jgi:crossover junction endodeoxyribonuclease RuvC
VALLSVDPSYTSTGYAVFARKDGKVFLVDAGYQSFKKFQTISHKISEFYDFILLLIKKHGVTSIALETPFLGKNAQTFLKLGYLRGVLHLIAMQNKITLQEFSPREIKHAVTGGGGSTKEEVALMISRLFPQLKEICKSSRDDVTDAIGIGICGIWKMG